ncbi:Rid family detoxifying hydrolase [Enterococcus ratti]|uniref:Rid family detoxifying hydrolase n=1 Tax=Enterococcus ratti TaxID=150033 RepID=UPI0035119842
MGVNNLPYERYRAAGNLIFVSGQLPIDPETGEICSENISEQTNQIMHNISEVLDELNLTMDDVVKTTCFLTDIKDFELFNQAYSKHFGKRFPARSAYQVAALPKGALVEIEWVLSTK